MVPDVQWEVGSTTDGVLGPREVTVMAQRERNLRIPPLAGYGGRGVGKGRKLGEPNWYHTQGGLEVRRN